MSLGFSSDPLSTDFEATRAGFGHRFAGAGPAVPGTKDPVPPYWITAKSNCPDFSLEFPIKLPEQARAIRVATGSEVFGAVKEFVEKTSQSTSVTSARGEDARMDKMRWTLEATADGRPQFPEFQRAIAERRLREPDKHSGVKPPTGGRVTVRDVICIQNLPVWWRYAAARREMKEEFARVGLGTNSVHYAVTSEPGLDGMRHLPTIDPAIGETMLFHCADVNAIENITRGGFLARFGGNYAKDGEAPRYGMLGQGSYFSNELAKGLTYTRCVLCGDYACGCRSLETKRKLARATIMARVILGNVRYYPAWASLRKKLGGRQGIERQFRPIAHGDRMYHDAAVPRAQQFDSAVSHGFSRAKFFQFGSEANEFMSPKDQLTYPEFVVSFVMGQDDEARSLRAIVKTVLDRYQGRSFGFLRKKSAASQNAERVLTEALAGGRSDEQIGDLVLYFVGVKTHVDGGQPGGQLKTDGTFFRYLTEELQKDGYLAVA